MKILFVLNNFYAVGNGLSASARRTVEYLKQSGQGRTAIEWELTRVTG